MSADHRARSWRARLAAFANLLPESPRRRRWGLLAQLAADQAMAAPQPDQGADSARTGEPSAAEPKRHRRPGGHTQPHRI